MPSEPTIDLDALAAPISADQPAGSYLKESDFERLQQAKDLRADAVAAERKLRELAMYDEADLLMIPEQDRHVETPNWRIVRDACLDILANHSKDLWVAAWLIEANTRLEGFAGLRDGFHLVAELVERYWSDIHPPADEDEGYLGTVSQLTSLNGSDSDGTLILPIYESPLIPGNWQLCYSSYRQATKGSGGDVTEAQFYTAARATDVDKLRAHHEDLQAAINAFKSMNELLEQRCGVLDGVPVAPPSSQILKTLHDCQEVFALITKDILVVERDDDQATDPDSSGLIAGSVGGDPVQTQVKNREDAFRLLLRASEFFLKTEPHSPVSYMLQQAVRFGRMQLPDLLKELITDDDVLARFAERTGIKIQRDGEQEEG